MTVHHHFVGAGESDIDPARLRCRDHVGHGQASDFEQCDRFGPGSGREACLLPRQHQQLFDQPGRAVDAGRKSRHRHCTRVVARRSLQALDLQFQRGQRGAQFVGRIGDEMFLRLEGMPHPAEQQVEFLHQRTHLVGQSRIAHRRQIVCLPFRELAPHPRHRCQRAAHHPPDRQHQQRHHQHDRAHRAQRQLAGHLPPRGEILRDLNHLRSRLHREHAVGGSVRVDVRKSEHRALRQRCAGRRFEHLQSVGRPHLDDEIEILFEFKRACRHAGARDRQARAQRHRHLLHVVVEYLVGLGQGGAVRHQSLGGGGERDGHQQEPEQAGAQRMAERHRHVGSDR